MWAIFTIDARPTAVTHLRGLSSRCRLRAALLVVRPIAGLSVPEPAGTFYLFPDFTAQADRLARRGISDSTAMCKTLLDQTVVALLPGRDFARPADELTARLALVDFDGAKALVAVGTLAPDAPVELEFLTAHCAPVLQAIDRITDWVG